MAKQLIRLVGPGGAGKSVAGAALARCLCVPFLDLDDEFKLGAGDISEFIATRGYAAYTERNVDVYWKLTRGRDPRGVLALSSGFMIYPPEAHREYVACRQEIVASPTTFVLLPAVDLETCVAETVRRQIARSFGRTAAREEAVIRERFTAYFALPARKITTMRPVREVCDDILAALAA